MKEDPEFEEQIYPKKNIFQKMDWPNLLAIGGMIFMAHSSLKTDISEVRKDVNDLQQRMAVVETVLKINYSIAQKPIEEKKCN